MAIKSKIIDGKKFMWDGRTYGSEADAKQVEETYRKNGFETKLIEEGEQYFVYTRRVVKEVKVEGPPPL